MYTCCLLMLPCFLWSCFLSSYSEDQKTLSFLTFLHFPRMSSSEKAMATHSSTLAWKIPWTEGPGGLQSMRSLWVGHEWATSLSLFTFPALEKEMATHSGVLAWRIPGMGEPGGLPSMGSHRVGHDWSDLAAAVAEKEASDNHSFPEILGWPKSSFGF